jgi:hypothetical protein
MTSCGKLDLPFLVSLALLLPAIARAAPIARVPELNPDERPRYRFVYDVPAECPRKEEFLARVIDRVGKEWLVSSDERAGTLALSVTKTGDLSTAHMTLVDVEGRVAFRTLQGSSCPATLSDMAVAVAAAIESRLGPQPPYWEFGIGGGVDRRTGLWSFGGNMFAGLRWPTSRRTLRATLSYWDTAAQPASEAREVRLRFTLFSARCEFCPLEVGLGAGFALPLCAAAEGGVLLASRVYAQGSDESAEVGAWLASGLGPRVRLTLNSVFFQLGANADVVLYPGKVVDVPRVEGRPSSAGVLHDIPRFGLSAVASVGVGIW